MKALKKAVAALMVAACLAGCATSCASDSVKTRDLTWAVGGALPQAEDFAVELPDGYSARYAKKYSFEEYGSYDLEVIITSSMGFESRHKVKLELVKDKTAPGAKGLTDLVTYLGEGGVSYLSGVEADDNCDNPVVIDVDTSAVRLKETGVYPVIYTLTDAAGNVSVFRMTLTVLEQEITEEMLHEELDGVIDEIIDDGMSKKQKLRAVYDYVYDNVTYTSIADKSGWVSAAYEGLTTGKGDCYTYFALSKAFFERLGIENCDVEREQAAVIKTGERHFWNMVNLGDENDPAWYHFDTCRLKGMSKPWGFLLTDQQLKEYSEYHSNAEGTSEYFYVYDKDSVPASAKTVITHVD